VNTGQSTTFAASGIASSSISWSTTTVRGDFRAGDPVRLLDPDAKEIGRGLARYPSVDAVLVAGKARADLEVDRAVLVHRDDLVVG
jgi:glutamate 5-kinase